METITTLTLGLAARGLSRFTQRHQTLLAKPLDDLPLADGHAALVDLVRSKGPQPFAFRVPDDARLLTVWHSSGTAALVATYWQHRLAHVDLMLASAASSLASDVLADLPITGAEIESIQHCTRPLLVFCRVREGVPAIAEILGMIAYMPVLLAVHSE